MGDDEASNLDELLDQLENISEDSESDRDNVSIISTPKPSLPTYFGKCGSCFLNQSRMRNQYLVFKPHHDKHIDLIHKQLQITLSAEIPTKGIVKEIIWFQNNVLRLSLFFMSSNH